MTNSRTFINPTKNTCTSNFLIPLSIFASHEFQRNVIIQQKTSGVWVHLFSIICSEVREICVLCMPWKVNIFFCNGYTEFEFILS